MKEDVRTLDDIVAAVNEAGGSITGAAEILGVSKQAVSKRLRGVKVLCEIWNRRDGDGKMQEVFEKDFRQGFAERVVPAFSHLIRKASKVQGDIALYKERLDDMRSRAEAAKAEAEAASRQAASLEDVGDLAGKIAEARSTQQALEDVSRNVQTLIGERQLELDGHTKELKAATRRAVLAFRENVRRDEFLGRLKAVEAMDRAFSKVVAEELNRLGKDRGVPIGASVLSLWESDLLPAGDELGSVIRSLEDALSAQDRADEAQAKAEEYETRFKTSTAHPHRRVK